MFGCFLAIAIRIPLLLDGFLQYTLLYVRPDFPVSHRLGCFAHILCIIIVLDFHEFAVVEESMNSISNVQTYNIG